MNTRFTDKKVPAGTAPAGRARECRPAMRRFAFCMRFSMALAAVFLLAGCGRQEKPDTHPPVSGKAVSPRQAVADKAAADAAQKIAKIAKPAELARIVREDKSRDARLAALEKLADQKALAELVSDGADMEARQKAMAKITDTLLLADLDPWVNPEAAQKTADAALLAKLATRAWLAPVRKMAVQKVTDIETLTAVALADPSGAVRKMAVIKLADPDVLAKIAGSDAAWYVRQAAVGKINDSAVLAGIARNDTDAFVSRAALAKLKDETAILDVALHTVLETVRTNAMDALTTQQMLARVVRETRDADLQGEAYKRLTEDPLKSEAAPWLDSKAVGTVTDQTLLGKLAESGLLANVREAAAAKLEDPALLYRIAMANESEPVREAAANRIKDQAALQMLVAESTNEVREIAVKKLEDQRLLEKIAATTNESYSARKAAVEALKDEQALIRIAKDENMGSGLRAEAVSGVRNQEVLAQLARGERDGSVRDCAFRGVTNAVVRAELEPWIKKAAVEKITGDRTLLARIAAESATPEVRQIAAEKLGDQRLLFSIASSNEYPDSVQKAAVKALTNQAQLESLACETNLSCETRIEAITKLTNASILASLANLTGTDNRDGMIREAAIGKLTDQALLVQIATSTNSASSVRLAAVKQIHSQEALARIAISDEDDKVRSAAEGRVTNQVILAALKPWSDSSAAETVSDQALLIRIARESKTPAVRKTAIARVTDQAMLAEVAEKDADKDVRQTAAKRLTDTAVLAKIAAKDKDKDNRRFATERISDQGVLESIARDDGEASVRQAAIERVTSQEALAELARYEPDNNARQAAAKRVTDTTLRTDVEPWTNPDVVRKEDNPFLLTRIARTAADKNVCQAAMDQLTQSTNQSPLVAYEWLSHRLNREGKRDDAVLALLMATVVYDQDSADNSPLSQTTFDRANELRDQSVLQAGLSSLKPEGEATIKVSLADVSAAVQEKARAALRCQEGQLEADITNAFHKALLIKTESDTPNPPRYLDGDIAFVSALGLSMQQRREDWPAIERYLASNAYHPKFVSYLKAMAAQDPAFEKMLLSHPSVMIRANALIALEKPAPDEESDLLVRCAGAWNPRLGQTNEAVRLLETALEDERHVVRVTALRGLTRLGAETPVDKIKLALTTSDEWRKKYSRSYYEFQIDGQTLYIPLDESRPSPDAVDGSLLQAGLALIGNRTSLDANTFEWQLQQLKVKYGEECPKFYLSTNMVVNGYRVECAQRLSAERQNADLVDIIAKHAPDHAGQLLNALDKADPYGRMVLLQATGSIATNSAMRKLLWHIAEGEGGKREYKQYRDKLYTDKVAEVSKNLGWNQSVNYSGVSDYADTLAQKILEQSRRLAVNQLASTAEDPAEFERLAALLSDGQTARAAFLVLLNRDNDFMERYAPESLLKHEHPEVRLCSAMIRLCLADSPAGREALAGALKGDQDRVAFAARVALQTKKPAIVETVRSAEDVKSVSVAGYLVRRLMQEQL